MLIEKNTNKFFNSTISQAEIKNEELKAASLKTLTLELNEWKDKYVASISINDKLIAEQELLKSQSIKQDALKSDLAEQLKNLKKLHDAVLIENGRLKHQYDELKQQFSELECSSEQIQAKYLNIKEELESQQRRKSLDRTNEMLKDVFELDEQKKNPVVAGELKKNLKTDRKARRYSQHDESRSLLNETAIRPINIAIQTDPSNSSCGCITMDLKIKDLSKNLKIQECIINTLKLELENHPAKVDIALLKRVSSFVYLYLTVKYFKSLLHDFSQKLDEKQAELNLLQLNVIHYRAKSKTLNGHVSPCRECKNRNEKNVVHQEVQVESPTIELSFNSSRPLGPLAHHQAHLQQKYDAAKRQILELKRQIQEVSVIEI